jgi:hypothetical protein
MTARESPIHPLNLSDFTIEELQQFPGHSASDTSGGFSTYLDFGLTLEVYTLMLQASYVV